MEVKMVIAFDKGQGKGGEKVIKLEGGRHVLVPIREELGEGEAEWIMAVAETVINPVLFKHSNQITEKRLTNGTAEKA
jgi:hypothetical protein